MCANLLLLLCAGSSESGTCFGIIFCHPTDKTFHEMPAVSYRGAAKTVFPHRRQSIGSGDRVVLCQCANEPAIGHTLHFTRIFRTKFIDQFMHGPSIGFPVQFHHRAPGFLSTSFGSTLNARSKTASSSA